jgi:hypothetical protein
MTALIDAAPALTEAERRRALSEGYSYLLTLAARRRAAQTTTTTEPGQAESSDHDHHKEAKQ